MILARIRLHSNLDITYIMYYLFHVPTVVINFLFTHMSKISIPNAIIYEALDRGIYFEDAVPQLRIPVLRRDFNQSLNCI